MKPKKPHILLITTDEQHRDTVFAQRKPYSIPGIERLLSQATNYGTCYTASPVCLPSRCTWMTGLYPFSTSCCSNRMGRSLPLNLPNLFTCLKQAGYHTSMHGKCHFVPVPYPATRKDVTQEYEHFLRYYQSLGMDHLDVQDGNNVSLWYYDDYSKEMEEKDCLKAYKQTYQGAPQPFRLLDFPLENEDHPDTWVGRKALDWIARQDLETPQFTWVSFSGPHYPMDAPSEWFDRIDMEQDLERIFRPGEWDGGDKIHCNGYNGPGTTEGSGNAPGGAQREFTEEYWREWRKRYYANVVQIDAMIGKIISLAEEKYGDNLMIIFTSDHGDMMGNHSLWGKNFSLHEDVLRVPLVIRYPGQTQKQEVSETVNSVDLFPTILEQACCEIPAECDGKPLHQVVSEGGRDVIVSSCEGRIAVIENGCKLCKNRYDRTGQVYMELYDLNRDPHEFENVWNRPEYADAQAGLLARLDELEQRSAVLSVLFEHKTAAGRPYWYSAGGAAQPMRRAEA